MIILGIEIRRIRPARIAKVPALTELELNRAFQVAHTDPQWCAVLQLLETAEQNANAQAAAQLDSTNRMAGYVGGAEHLAMFRTELIRRRELGLEDLRTRPDLRAKRE